MTIAAGSAQAGDAYSSETSAPGVRPQQCGAGQSCARISGYIKARSDAVPSGPAPLAAPPLLAGIGSGVNALGQATSDALNHGMFFLRTSSDANSR